MRSGLSAFPSMEIMTDEGESKTPKIDPEVKVILDEEPDVAMEMNNEEDIFVRKKQVVDTPKVEEPATIQETPPVNEKEDEDNEFIQQKLKNRKSKRKVKETEEKTIQDELRIEKQKRQEEKLARKSERERKRLEKEQSLLKKEMDLKEKERLISLEQEKTSGILKQKKNTNDDDEDFEKFYKNFKKYAMIEQLVRGKIQKEEEMKRGKPPSAPTSQPQPKGKAPKREEPVMDILEKEDTTYDYQKNHGMWANYI